MKKNSFSVDPALISLILPVSRLFAHLPDVYFFAKNTKGQFVHANEPFVRMVGAKSLEDVLGKNDYDFAPADLAVRFVRDDQMVVRTGKSIERHVELVPNADGSITWHETSKIPLTDTRGRIRGLAGFTRDLHSGEISWRRFQDLAPVVEYIAKNYAEPCRISDLAALVHKSVSQFERVFRASFGLSPARYVQKIRLQQTCRRLATTNDKIVEIAVSCGFYDHSHFTRSFRADFGVSPGAYRKRQLKGGTTS
jgi:PAS domain S-box-containing protein